MQRAVHMFPEVFHMDVIANTNRQKRDLFVLVIKDASGETNIGNASVLPCGKLWIFWWFTKSFFVTYMETLRFPICDWRWLMTILLLTAQLMPPPKLWKSYRLQSTCCLCFHAVVMCYQDLVYGRLPKTRDNKTLAAKGVVYGELTPSTL